MMIKIKNNNHNYHNTNHHHIQNQSRLFFIQFHHAISLFDPCGWYILADLTVSVAR